MGHHDRQLREVGSDVVEQHRVGVAQLDAVPARQPGADAGLAGMEQRRHSRVGDRLVDRIETTVVRLEGLHAGVKLEALDAVVADQLVDAVHRASLMPRVDAAERDQHVVVANSARDEEDNWINTIRETSIDASEFAVSCTPGYYNNEGGGGGEGIRSAIGEPYMPGFYAFDDLLKEWR